LEDVAARMILVIDDDDNVRRSVRQVLKHAGWAVEQANDGEAGLRLIEQRLGPYALVITDLQMPRLDGRAVAETLGQCRPRQAVLCMSGSTAECPPVGPHDSAFPFLAKPFTQQALHEAVQRAIEHATLDRPARGTETREATRDLVAYARAMRRP
jgi:two-component system cell cycle sensor histidine kinase/response regulator CckA